MVKDVIKFEIKYGYALIDGKYYKPSHDKEQRMVLTECPNAKAVIQKAKDMAKILESALSIVGL